MTENVDDSDLYASIVGEATELPEASQAEQQEPEVEAVAAETETEEQPVATGEKPVVDDNAPQVPSWRVREINEEKRALAAERDALLAERSQWQQHAQPAKVVEQPKEPSRPDPLLDPEGYEKYLEEKVEARLLTQRREDSLQAAREANPTEFDEAYKAAQQNVDPALRARMQASRDPGKTLLEWHRESKVKAEVGNDPKAWLEKKLEEHLNDPAFLAKAIERSRAVVQPQSTNGRPRVELPPSLNGASRSNALLRSTANDDVSDEQLFHQTTG